MSSEGSNDTAPDVSAHPNAPEEPVVDATPPAIIDADPLEHMKGKTWSNLEKRSANQIQMAVRCWRSRRIALALAQQVIEKIKDPRTSEFYYYNKKTFRASWVKPRVLGTGDIAEVAATYTDLQATIMLQTAVRRGLAQRRVRKQLAGCLTKIFDETTNSHYYYNSTTGATSWDKPSLLGSQDVEDFQEDTDDDEAEDGAKEDGGGSDDDDDDDDEEDSATFSGSEGSEEDGVLPRSLYPRTKMQLIVDEAEDTAGGALRLDLSRFGVGRVSSRIYSIETLTELNLSHNRLTGLSDDLASLENLTSLNVSHNQIKHMPVEIEELADLTRLDFSHNLLITYPANLYVCKKLVALNIGHNRIQKIPLKVGDLDLLKVCREWEVGIGQLTALQDFNMAHNAVQEFPEQLERCTSLSRLDLSHNQLSEIPQQVSALQGLTCLSFAYNNVSTFPEAVVPMKRLRQLDCSGNPFPMLPLQMRDWSKLAELVVDKTAMLALDNSVVDLKGLRILRIRRGVLSKVSPQIGRLIMLHSLDFSDNGITGIPDSLSSATSLVDLNLSRNKLTKAPGKLKKLLRLEHLDVSFNRLKILDGPDFVSLVSLETLNLSHNALTELPPQLFKLAALTTLDVSHNQVPTLPSQIGGLKSIRVADLSHNELTSIPTSVSELLTLEELRLEHNRLSELPESFGALTQLQKLHLTANDFQSPPDLLSQLTAMPCLSLGQNPVEDYRAPRRKDQSVLAHLCRGLEQLEADGTFDFEVADSETKRALEGYSEMHPGGRVSDTAFWKPHHKYSFLHAAAISRHLADELGDVSRMRKAQLALQETLEALGEQEASDGKFKKEAELLERIAQLRDDSNERREAIASESARVTTLLDESESVLNQTRVCGNGLEVVFGRAQAYLRSSKPHAAINDSNRLLSERKQYEPAQMLRAQARETLGQYSQAKRDCLKAQRGQYLSPAEHESLAEVSAEVDLGLLYTRKAGINDPNLTRVFDITPEGIVKRREMELIELLKDGRSRKRTDLEVRATMKRRAMKVAVDYDAGRILDIESAKVKQEKARKNVEKSRNARIARRKQDEEEQAKKRAEEARQKKLAEEARLRAMQESECEAMYEEEMAQRRHEAKQASKEAQMAAQAQEDSEDLEELLRSRRGRRRK